MAPDRGFRNFPPIGGGPVPEPESEEDKPVDRASPPPLDPAPPSEVVFTRYEEPVPSRRRFAFLRWRRRSEKKLSERFAAASKRPGFKPFIATLLVIDVLLVLSLVVLLPIPLVVLFGTLLLIAGSVILVRRVINQAFDPIRARPDGAVIPTRGRPKWKYRINRFYGRPDKVPVMVAEELLFEKNRHRENRIIQLFQLGIQPVIWIGNSSGKNVKSMMAVIIASILGKLTNIPVVVIPTMANDRTATAGKLTGLKGKSASLRRLSKMIEDGELKDPEQLYAVLFSNRHSAFVVSENPLGDRDVGGYVLTGRWRRVFLFLRRLTKLIVQDTGNDGAHDGSVTVEGIMRAHVALFTAWVENWQGMDKLHEALGEYWVYADELPKGKPMGSRISPEDIPIREMVERAVVVFNAVDPETELEEYRRHVRIGPEEEAPFEGNINFVRFDEYLKTLLEGFDLDNMATETYGDYLAIIVLLFERTAELLGVEIPERHPFIAGDNGLSLTPQPKA